MMLAMPIPEKDTSIASLSRRGFAINSKRDSAGMNTKLRPFNEMKFGVGDDRFTRD